MLKALDRELVRADAPDLERLHEMLRRAAEAKEPLLDEQGGRDGEA